MVSVGILRRARVFSRGKLFHVSRFWKPTRGGITGGGLHRSPETCPPTFDLASLHSPHQRLRWCRQLKPVPNTERF